MERIEPLDDVIGQPINIYGASSLADGANGIFLAAGLMVPHWLMGLMVPHWLLLATRHISLAHSSGANFLHRNFSGDGLKCSFDEQTMYQHHWVTVLALSLPVHSLVIPLLVSAL